MTSEALSALLLLCVVGFPICLYYIVMRRYSNTVPHLAAAKKSARSSNYGRAQKKLFNLILAGKRGMSSERISI
jgi:hypothetical protein